MIKTKYVAEYFYPGVLFPETVTREIDSPTWENVLASAPDEGGYFNKDGWYAARVTKITKERYTSDSGKVTWAETGFPEKVISFAIGERIHWSNIEDNDRNSILISNIKYNSKDGCGIKTRVGNWQFSSDWDVVVDPSMV